MYEFLLVADILLWLITVALYVRQGRASMFHPATYYLVFHFLVFVLRPVLAYYWTFGGIYDAYHFSPSDEVKSMALMAADLGLVAFMTASMRTAKMPLIVRNSSVVFDRDQPLRNAFLITMVLLLPIGLYSTYVSLGELSTGTTTMVLDQSTGYTVNTTGNGYFLDVQLVLGTLAVLFVWIFRQRWYAWLVFFAFIVGKGATGGRWPIVVGGLTVVTFYLYEKRRRWPGVVFMLGAVLMLQFFQFVGQDRGARIRALFTEQDNQREIPTVKERPLESMDFANMEFLEYLVWVIPEKSGSYNYFLDNLQLFTEPVPRVLWAGKPIGAPIQKYDLWKFGSPIGMTFSLPGEGWVQLGWIGVALWCGLIGAAYGKLYNAFMRSQQTPFLIALYAIFVPTSITFFRDGGLLTMAKTSLFTLAPVLVWMLVYRLIGGRTQGTHFLPAPAPRAPERRVGA